MGEGGEAIQKFLNFVTWKKIQPKGNKDVNMLKVE